MLSPSLPGVLLESKDMDLEWGGDTLKVPFGARVSVMVVRPPC